MSRYIFDEPYVRIPESVLSSRNLSHGAKLCYARIVQFADEDGYAFPKQTTLAEGMGVSRRQLNRFIAELRSANLIEIQRRGLGLSNVYSICEGLSTDFESD